jgi:hypothetical protein
LDNGATVCCADTHRTEFPRDAAALAYSEAFYRAISIDE